MCICIRSIALINEALLRFRNKVCIELGNEKRMDFKLIEYPQGS